MTGRAPRYFRDPKDLFSIVGNFGEFQEFKAAGGGAARSKPALLPGQFWQVSIIITGNAT